MSRPANVDSAQTRLRILEAASGLFSQHGSGHTSIRDVAKRSKVSVATVHFHFGSKDRLWDACIDAMNVELASLQVDLVASLQEGKGDDARLDSAVRAVYRFALRHQPAIRLLLRNVLETGEIGTRNREERLLPFLDGAATLLESWTSRNAAELRLVLQTLVFLVGRYAIGSTRELAAAAGLPANAKPEKIQARIEDHLADTAARLLAPPTPAPRRSR